jgi:hypothetical protein
LEKIRLDNSSGNCYKRPVTKVLTKKNQKHLKGPAMKSLNRFTCVSAAIGICLVASGAYAQVTSINSAKITPRVFNDYPGATGNYVNSYPGSITLGESGEFNPPGPGTFANKDIWQFSNNGGASAYTLGAGDTLMTISATLTLGPDTGTLDNEAGWNIPNVNGTLPGGDLFFIAKACQDHFLGFFGGPGFWNSGISYVAGTSAKMTATYWQTGATGNMQFSVTDGITVTSPVESWTGSLAGDTVGAYYQLQGVNSPTGPGTSGQAVWSNITIVPEPATIALLGLGILPLARLLRRRA